ncbi:MAG TPA: flagellar export chaperone FliS [Burkholderiaceae bacterium]|nr:flagellar export chaperone FliS [Burkholderiaceae bacterium]
MTYAPPRGFRRSSANAYANVGLETQVLSASPERLITLLFEGALSAIAKARLHLEQGNIAERGLAISKAIDIVDSGLKASVDVNAGGEVAKNLIATYEIVLHNLMLANLNADDERLQLAQNVLQEISSAWREACDTPKEQPSFQART